MTKRPWKASTRSASGPLPGTSRSMRASTGSYSASGRISGVTPYRPRASSAKLSRSPWIMRRRVCAAVSWAIRKARRRASRRAGRHRHRRRARAQLRRRRGELLDRARIGVRRLAPFGRPVISVDIALLALADLEREPDIVAGERVERVGGVRKGAPAGAVAVGVAQPATRKNKAASSHFITIHPGSCVAPAVRRCGAAGNSQSAAASAGWASTVASSPGSDPRTRRGAAG